MSVSLLCVISNFGYYVAFEAELYSCDTSYDINPRRFILAILCGELAVLLTFWILFFIVLYNDYDEHEEKYREMYPSSNTEANEPLTKNKDEPMRRVDDTKEQIYVPPKKDSRVYYSK